MVAAFTCASGQVREAPLENGQIEDLKGVIKVYVGTSDQSPSLPTTGTIIETVRKRLPQITVVSLREEADVWLLFSAERYTETEINPDPSVDRSSTKFVTILTLRGRVIRLRGTKQVISNDVTFVCDLESFRNLTCNQERLIDLDRTGCYSSGQV